MVKKKIVFNGQFTARPMTGQERFAYELLIEVDKLITNEQVEIVVPRHATRIPELSQIKVVKYGNLRGSLWEQTSFAYYLIKNNAVSINLCSIMPLIKPGFICIHDISYKVNPEYFTTFYSTVSKFWHKIQYNFAWLFSDKIFTVSEFSKKQMIDVYKVPSEKIIVIGNGWQHFNKIIPDYSIFEKWPKLKEAPFFFSLGSLAPNKNIEWILKAARKNPNYNFCIAGNPSMKAYGKDYREIDIQNVFFLGYINDGNVKALMTNCKAFIFPSIFEGFGIPPLEAMSVGAKVIVSNTSCLPEIYEDAAYYIDPFNYNVNLEELLKKTVAESGKILDKYSFEKFASKLWNEIINDKSN